MARVCRPMVRNECLSTADANEFLCGVEHNSVPSAMCEHIINKLHTQSANAALKLNLVRQQKGAKSLLKRRRYIISAVARQCDIAS